jgi:hypothetical protein
VTIHINRRLAAVVAVLAALAVALTFAAYMYGESTRQSDEQVSTLVSNRVKVAVEERGEQAERDQAAALKKAVKSAKTWQFKRDNKRWKQRLEKAVKAAEERGYSNGNSAGYSAGNRDGYSSGHEDGHEEGIEDGSDELVCSDDLDVDLPPCW